MTRRRQPSRACSALAVLAALAPRCAGGAEAQAALSLALGAASGRALARCEYACDAAGCGALRACTPAAAHEAADAVRCTEPETAAAAGRCATFAPDCASCPPLAPFAQPWNASSALGASRHLAGDRPRRLAAAGGAPTPSALGDAATAASLRVSPGCERVVPLGIPLITYTNAHHFDILLLMLRVARESALQCVLERVVTLCLDDGCMDLCTQHGLECLRYSAYTLGAAEARARGASYRTITFIKWLIMQEVVEKGDVEAVLFFDDDVLLMGNPFSGFDWTAYDFRHQAERGAGCAAKPNGGLLFVRATPAGRALLRNMVAKKDAIEATGDKLDQEYIAGAAAEAGATRCALPRAHFIGHCPYAQHASAPLRGIITYHTHCCGEHDGKIGLLTRLAAARVATPDARFADVDRVPLPGKDMLTDTCYYPHWSDMRALRRAWAKVDAALEWPSTPGGAGPSGQRALQGRLAGDILH